MLLKGLQAAARGREKLQLAPDLGSVALGPVLAAPTPHPSGLPGLPLHAYAARSPLCLCREPAASHRPRRDEGVNLRGRLLRHLALPCTCYPWDSSCRCPWLLGLCRATPAGCVLAAHPLPICTAFSSASALAGARLAPSRGAELASVSSYGHLTLLTVPQGCSSPHLLQPSHFHPTADPAPPPSTGVLHPRIPRACE